MYIMCYAMLVDRFKPQVALGSVRVRRCKYPLLLLLNYDPINDCALFVVVAGG